MALLIKHWRAAAAAVLAVFTVWSLTGGRIARTCAVVVDAREVSALCGEDCREADVWERLKTMGASGALLHPESLESRIAAGDIFRYTQEEIAKLRETKVAAADAPLAPGALWVRSEAMLERLRRAAEAHRVGLALHEYEGQRVATLPKGLPFAGFSAGFDPERLRRVKEMDLAPVFYVRTVPELLLAEGDGVVALIAPEFLGIPDARVAPSLRAGRVLGFADAPAAHASDASIGRSSRSERAVFLRETETSVRMAGVGEARVGDGEAAFLREAAGRGDAMVVARFDMTRGLEENLLGLRAILKRLRRAGFAPSLDGVVAARRLSAPEWAMRGLLGFLLTVAAPILSLRWGIGVLRHMQMAGRLPEASPFREAFTGAGVATAAGILLGSAAYAILDVAAWRLGAVRPDWLPWGEGVTFVLAFLALYDPDPKVLRVVFRRTVGSASELWVALPVAAATLIFISPYGLRDLGIGAWVEGVDRAAGSWWWISARWKEWIVGYPCLFIGFCVFFERIDALSRKRDAPDPRGWLLLGMFAPVGLARVFSSARMPVSLLVSHTLQGAVGGVLLGLLLLAARQKIRNRLHL